MKSDRKAADKKKIHQIFESFCNFIQHLWRQQQQKHEVNLLAEINDENRK